MSRKLCGKQEARQLEGNPVIHQGMTVQLFVPVLCSGSLSRAASSPASPSLACLVEQNRLGLCLITSGGGMARLGWGQVFIYLLWLFLGWGG